MLTESCRTQTALQRTLQPAILMPHRPGLQPLLQTM